jgi:hypothetical protein
VKTSFHTGYMVKSRTRTFPVTAGSSVQEAPSEIETGSGEITSIEGLGAAPGVKTSGIEQFERSLGIDETETSWNGSRKWRDPGRLARGRE